MDEDDKRVACAIAELKYGDWQRWSCSCQPRPGQPHREGRHLHEQAEVGFHLERCHAVLDRAGHLGHG
jgi:hypothetical protein